MTHMILAPPPVPSAGGFLRAGDDRAARPTPPDLRPLAAHEQGTEADRRADYPSKYRNEEENHNTGTERDQCQRQPCAVATANCLLDHRTVAGMTGKFHCSPFLSLHRNANRGGRQLSGNPG